MNLVGPRPHPASSFELLTLVARNLNDVTGGAVGYYALRSMVRPGITGWAQVRYRYANDLDEEIEKLRYDLYYVKNVSALLDLRIMLDTVVVMAEGRPQGPRGAPGARCRRCRSPRRSRRGSTARRPPDDPDPGVAVTCRRVNRTYRP